MPKKTQKTKLRIKRGDNVIVLAGKDRGATGKVMEVDPVKQRVIVENVNMMTKTQRPTQENPRGGFLEQEAPIHISNVAFVDPQSGEPSRIRYELTEAGEKVRVSVKSGTRIDQ